MRRLTIFIVLASLAAAPLHAASDSGLSLHGQAAGGVKRGFGALAVVTAKFGHERAVRGQERFQLGLAAGPILSVQDRRATAGVRRNVASIAGFTLRPGHSATLTLVGQPLVTRYGPKRIGHDLQPRKATLEGDRLHGFGKTAAIAALAAGVVVAGILIAVNIDCNTGDGCTS